MIPAEKRRADRQFWSFVRDLLVAAFVVVLMLSAIRAADYAMALLTTPVTVFAGDQK